jgi:hypothetical protein
MAAPTARVKSAPAAGAKPHLTHALLVTLDFDAESILGLDKANFVNYFLCHALHLPGSTFPFGWYGLAPGETVQFGKRQISRC